MSTTKRTGLRYALAEARYAAAYNTPASPEAVHANAENARITTELHLIRPSDVQDAADEYMTGEKKLRPWLDYVARGLVPPVEPPVSHPNAPSKWLVALGEGAEQAAIETLAPIVELEETPLLEPSKPWQDRTAEDMEEGCDECKL